MLDDTLNPWDAALSKICQILFIMWDISLLFKSGQLEYSAIKFATSLEICPFSGHQLIIEEETPKKCDLSLILWLDSCL